MTFITGRQLFAARHLIEEILQLKCMRRKHKKYKTNIDNEKVLVLVQKIADWQV